MECFYLRVCVHHTLGWSLWMSEEGVRLPWTWVPRTKSSSAVRVTRALNHWGISPVAWDPVFNKQFEHIGKIIDMHTEVNV